MYDNDIILTAVERVNPQSCVDYVLDILVERGCRDINEQIKTCRKCDIRKTGKSIVNPCLGRARGIMIVSEYLTQNQLMNGNKDTVFVPYECSNVSDKLGQLLMDRFTKEAICFTDIVHCYPHVDDKGFKPRPPTTKEINCCLPFFWQFVRLTRPVAMLLMGNVVVNALVPGKFIADRDHGKWIEVGDFRTPAMIFQKPDNVIGTDQEESFIADLNKFVNDLKNSNDETLTILLRKD